MVDIASRPTIRGVEFVELVKTNGPIGEIEKEDKRLLVCRRGKSVCFLQNRLKHFGNINTKVLEGASFVNEV